MPISVFTGMAGTMRLQNLIFNLKDNPNLRITNFIINSENSEEPENKIYEDKVKKICFNYTLKNPIKIILLSFSIISNLRYLYSRNFHNVIYNYGYPNIKNFLIFIGAKSIGYKIVFDIVEDNQTIKKYKSILSAIKIRSSIFLFNHIYWFADGAIAISQHLLQKLVQVSNNRFPVIHIPISINSAIFNTSAHKIDNHDVIKIFYGGSYGNKDGIEFLLMAFDEIVEENPNCRLLLSGRGSERDMTAFMKLLKAVKNIKKVDYLGYLSYDEYIRQLQTADIVCMTRNGSSYANSGFPFKLGEMLASGKPVIASKVGDVSVYLDDQSALLVKPESVDELKSAIRYLILNKEKAFEIGIKGREVAFRNFDSKILAGTLYEFLINL
jgi:glycosyltransferase involved in cell wall biosynthesis